ncbi:MAG: bacillithiol biosynthesis deacetylase BshB1 [Blastocatellia bacterium]
MVSVDVVAIFAHPDDMELSVGGTMLKLKQLGYRTAAIDVTRGEMGTRGTPQVRAIEAEKAAQILGLDVRDNLQLADGHVFADDNARCRLVRKLRELKPKLILTHQPGDPHPDHDHISTLVRESARLASMANYDPETGHKRIGVPRIAHTVFSARVYPSFIVDISEQLDTKMQAIRAHGSQFFRLAPDEPETRLTEEGFLDQIEARARYFGSLIGAAAGEPYFVREVLNIDDPVSLLTRPMNLYS